MIGVFALWPFKDDDSEGLGWDTRWARIGPPAQSKSKVGNNLVSRLTVPSRHYYRTNKTCVQELF
jgi:hypothetical protein